MSTPNFLEIQLDPLISYGSSGGLGYTTTTVTNPSRIETRFQLQSRGYWKMSLALGNGSDSSKNRSQMKGIAAHFTAVQGKTYGWRFRNWREYFTCTDNGVSGIMTAESISNYVSGTTMQLIHTRSYGGNTEIVPIRKPDLNIVAGITDPSLGFVQFKLFRDGSLTAWPSAGNYSLDVTTGIVTFNTDQTGHTFTWEGIWDTPCRFDLDDMSAEWSDFDEMNWSDIKVMEIQV